MSVSSFEILPDDVLYEIFGYLSPIDILQSLFLLTKCLSRIISNEYLWHIHIGDTTMSLTMLNGQCQNILKLIGGRVVSLRVTLIDVIGEWSLISSSSSTFNRYLNHMNLINYCVCSRMSLLKICRLPFDYDDNNVDQIENNSLGYQITLQNLLNPNHRRTLSIGIRTLGFLERL
ncbi:unnamed protein product [Rotaria magnacalcarata]|uniref:F-box domain-containing protein n=1 Tax=Rotaria magnacalcarata TaxID=392030 RepID=A0A819HHD1_9BILA|nr:unnamed protein product [Rotaria magnacalcarata]CAF3900907.1 unnamed protein product [Rotaria magnacalcarata]